MNSRHVTFTIKALLITFSLITMLVIAAFYSLPTLLTKQLPLLIEHNTGRKVSMAAVALQVSPFTLDVRDLVIHEKDGPAFLKLDQLSIQIDVLKSLQQATLIIDQISLKNPTLQLVRHKDGSFNFQSLILDQTAPKTAHGNVFPVSIAKLSITHGKLTWQDAQTARGGSETLEPFLLTVENISTQSDKPAHINLDFVLQSGGHFSLTTKVGLNPLTAQGHLKLERLNLSKFINLFVPDSGLVNINSNNAFDAEYQATYSKGKLKLSLPKATIGLHDIEYAQAGQSFKLADIKHETAAVFEYANENWQLEAKTAKTQAENVHVQDKLLGKLNQLIVEGAYRLSYHNKHLDMTVHQGSLESKELHLSDQEKNLAFFPALALRGVQVNIDRHTVKINSVSLNNAKLNAWLNADGSVNYQTLITANDTRLPTPEASWQINVDNIALNNCAVNFEDRSLPKPTTITLDPINLKISGYSNQASTRLPFELTAGVNKNGLVSLKGEVSLAPLTAEMTVNINNIDLEKFQPYYDQFIHLDVIDGRVNIDGKLSLQQQPTRPLSIQFSGNSVIGDLLIRDQRVHKDFLKWETLTLKELAVDVLSQRYTATELIIYKPYARVTIRKDKTVNFSGLLITDKNPSATPSPHPNTNPKMPYFKLGKIRIIEGSSDFTDLSLVLPFSAHIKSLDGGASGVSSEKNCQIQVALKGDAYDLTPVDIIGKVSPYLGEYQTKINFNGLPMPLVSSYMVQFAGYKVEKGKMTLNLDYHIANKKLTASNHFLIDQFELGERLQHPDAVSLPIKLAVALLKDSNGKIKIDVPVYGNLDNPQFNIGAIVSDALVNAISKIIRSPFSALASLTGGQESNLSTIHFKAGSAALDNSQQLKLDDIAAALQARPQLMLEIKGTTLVGQDWPAISDDALYDQLKIRRASEINQQSTRKIRPEYVELSNDAYQRLLAEMFTEKFPLLAEKPFLGILQLKSPKNANFYEVAKQKLQEIIKPEQERLKELANDRSQAIAKYIVQHGGIANERVYILDSVVNTEKENKEITSLLSLKVN